MSQTYTDHVQQGSGKKALSKQRRESAKSNIANGMDDDHIGLGPSVEFPGHVETPDDPEKQALIKVKKKKSRTTFTGIL